MGPRARARSRWRAAGPRSVRRSGLFILYALAALTVAGCGSCGSCGDGAEGLRVDDPAPHVRCLAAEPTREGSVEVGELTLSFDARVLTVSGVDPLRFAAFAGPAPFAVDLSTALADVRAAGVHFVVVLGSFGDQAPALAETLSSLAALDLPVFLVPGGRDDAVLLGRALEDLDAATAARVVDLSAFDQVLLGSLELLPVAGAPGGRYGRTDDACGFTADDLDDRADRIGEAGERPRYLLSWAAPAGGIGVGLAGADAGDPALEVFAGEVGVRGGLFAWPAEAAGRVQEDEGQRYEVVRRIAGAPAVRGDGARPAPGASYFTAGADGISSP